MPDACAVGPSRAADQSRLPLSLESTFGRAQNWNRFALIATINPKVRSIDGDHRVLREQFTHPHEAQIRKIGFSISVSLCETYQLNKVVSAVEGQRNKPFIDQGENHGRAFEVKRSFREDCLTGQEWLRNAGRDLRRPRVVLIVAVSKRDQESGVGNPLQGR